MQARTLRAGYPRTALTAIFSAISAVSAVATAALSGPAWAFDTQADVPPTQESPVAETSSAQPQAWSCRNFEFEISCSHTDCTASTAHTPMDISVAEDAMSVCAYTGCWEGAPSAVLTSGPFTTFVGVDMPFSSNPHAGGGDVTVSVNRKSGAGSVLVGELFATPLSCVARNKTAGLD